MLGAEPPTILGQDDLEILRGEKAINVDTLSKSGIAGRERGREERRMDGAAGSIFWRTKRPLGN